MWFDRMRFFGRYVFESVYFQSGYPPYDMISFTPSLCLVQSRTSSFRNPIPLISSSTCLLHVFRDLLRFL